MTMKYEQIRDEAQQLSVEELVKLQNDVAQYLQVKQKVDAESKVPKPQVRPPLPGSYQPTAEEVEASLARWLTPEELAGLGKTDFSKIRPGSKSITEMISEDREDRF